MRRRQVMLQEDDHCRLFVQVAEDNFGRGRRAMCQGLYRGLVDPSEITYGMDFGGILYRALLVMTGHAHPLKDHDAFLRSLMVFIGWEDARVVPLSHLEGLTHMHGLEGARGEALVTLIPQYSQISLELRPKTRPAILSGGASLLWMLAKGEPVGSPRPS